MVRKIETAEKVSLYCASLEIVERLCFFMHVSFVILFHYVCWDQLDAYGFLVFTLLVKIREMTLKIYMLILSMLYDIWVHLLNYNVTFLFE
jgi:hypothetical protein